MRGPFVSAIAANVPAGFAATSTGVDMEARATAVTLKPGLITETFPLPAVPWLTTIAVCAAKGITETARARSLRMGIQPPPIAGHPLLYGQGASRYKFKCKL